MCEITGVLNFNENNKKFQFNLDNSVKKMNFNDQNNSGYFFYEKYAIFFNGNFFNYKTYIKELKTDGVNFISETDIEVLLYLLIKYGTNAIEKINGGFIFAFYNLSNNQCIIARDRFGIKTLYYYIDEKNFFFASKLKTLLKYSFKQELNYDVLKTFFQLNYIPENQCIIKNVKKLKPGSYLFINDNNEIINEPYYKICNVNIKTNNTNNENYNDSCKKLYELLNDSVKMRLTADFPVGCFLSGGIDSSIITALAANNTTNLNTFSIGFNNNKFFDETKIAEIVAKKFNTNHTSFKVSNQDLLENITNVLEYSDEAFADSSALAINILSKLTSKKLNIVLSGDGADEIFAGYNKHLAHFQILNIGTKEKIIANLNYLWKILPKSRNSKITNIFRQLYRFSNAYKLSPQERYWNWASIANEKYINELLLVKPNEEEYQKFKNEYINFDFATINEILYADMNLVLTSDMLVKTNFTIANSLEVRTPFLDHNVVDFAFSLPDNYKITKNLRKKILKDSFKNILPEEVFTHPKHGLEVPLTDYLRTDLNFLIENFLNEKFIKEQNIFNYKIIKNLIKRLHSKNPDDSAAKIWALICFNKFKINTL